MLKSVQTRESAFWSLTRIKVVSKKSNDTYFKTLDHQFIGDSSTIVSMFHRMTDFSLTNLP